MTSGDEGRTGSVFTQLACTGSCVWPTSPEGAYQLYDTYQQAFDNLFFARVDSYARARRRRPRLRGPSMSWAAGEAEHSSAWPAPRPSAT